MSKTFKDYEATIVRTVYRINSDDANWDWSVHSITEDLVEISWGYLDYCNETNKYFTLKLMPDDTGDEGEYIMTARDPQESIDCLFVKENPDRSWQCEYESAIVALLEEIADYAHSRY